MPCESGTACEADKGRVRDLKVANQMKLVGFMNIVRIIAEEIVERKIIYI